MAPGATRTVDKQRPGWLSPTGPLHLRCYPMYTAVPFDLLQDTVAGHQLLQSKSYVEFGRIDAKYNN